MKAGHAEACIGGSPCLAVALQRRSDRRRRVICLFIGRSPRRSPSKAKAGWMLDACSRSIGVERWMFSSHFSPITFHLSPITFPTCPSSLGARHGGARPRRRRVGCSTPARDPSELSIGRCLLCSDFCPPSFVIRHSSFAIVLRRLTSHISLSSLFGLSSLPPRALKQKSRRGIRAPRRLLVIS
jgi:hypothetical protein